MIFAVQTLPCLCLFDPEEEYPGREIEQEVYKGDIPVIHQSNPPRSPAINPTTIRHPGASGALSFFPVFVLLSLFGVNRINKPIEMMAVQLNIIINICIIQK